jgi:hypothetical protein
VPHNGITEASLSFTMPSQVQKVKAFPIGASLHRDFVQADILDGSPDNGQATGLRGEDIDLIGALPHIAEQTLNRIRRLNVAVHPLRKGKKGQEVLFILAQAAHRFGIAHSVLGFEGC